MQSIVQIIKVNDLRDREYEGRKYQTQDAECILLNDDGTPAQVGVLKVPRDLLGNVQTGTFIGSFALRPDLKTRVLTAVLTGLQPYVAPKTQPVTK